MPHVAQAVHMPQLTTAAVDDCHAEVVLAQPDSAVASRELLRHEERSHSTTRGHLTRERKKKEQLETRAANGVCPCCHRTFKQLARHMKTKHPDFPGE